MIVAVAVTFNSCDGSSGVHLDITIPQTAREAVTDLFSRSWSFTYETLPTKGHLARMNIFYAFRPVGTGCGFSSGHASVVPPTSRFQTVAMPIPGGSQAELASDSATVVALPDGTFRQYSLTWEIAAVQRHTVDVDVWTATSTDLSNPYWQEQERLLTLDPWSLSAAPTPGFRHVRLYLESEGMVATMVSEKDTFDLFQDEGSPRFVDTDGRVVKDLRLRDPNVTLNGDGVYAMTWDNRRPRTRPGSDEDAVAVSRTIGLAFSVDGLNWTVYSNEMQIENLPGIGVRQVVPVFVKDNQLRLHFTYGFSCDTSRCTLPIACSLGTAISN